VNAEVIFINDTRGGDKVVSADLGEDAQGSKELKVHVNPEPTEQNPVVLKIERTAGDEGSATFDGADPGDGTTLTLTGGGDAHPDGGEVYQLKILGGDTSSEVRNMAINASNDTGTLLAKWEFTVFHVTPTPYFATNVNVKDVLPEAVKNHLGQSLQARIIANAGTDPTLLGHHIVEDRQAHGIIVIRGTIVPSGMDPNDFYREFNVKAGFDWDRRISGRHYDMDGCLFIGSDILEAVASDNRWDSSSSFSKDLIADPDGGDGDLMIWSYDVPKLIPASITNQGDILRLRKNWTEAATYASVRASVVVTWYWRTSIEHTQQGSLRANNDFEDDGDHQLAAAVSPNTATTPLTPDVVASAVPAPTVTGIQPDQFTANLNNPISVVTGTDFDGGGACGLVIYAIQEISNDTGGKWVLYHDTVNNPAATDFVADWNRREGDNIGEYVGDYDVKVFVADKVVTVPGGLKINPAP